AKNIEPLFPFGFGLSYTTFGYSNLQVGALSGGNATVHVTVTNTGSRAGTDVAQLYVGFPAASGEPPHQLRGYQRVTLNPGQSQTLTFTVSTHDLASWSTGSNNWTTAAGNYQILVGDSSRSLPVTGTLNVPTTVNGAIAAALSPQAAAADSAPAATAGALSVPNPHGMSSPVRSAVDWAFDPADAAAHHTYTATGLPPGITLSADGTFTGAATAKGSWTVTVTAKATTGAAGSATFVWTTT
ncbi:fibronectin type III-like domain-contianing protein, partial [Streptomyces sp. NPDC004031]